MVRTSATPHVMDVFVDATPPMAREATPQHPFINPQVHISHPGRQKPAAAHFRGVLYVMCEENHNKRNSPPKTVCVRRRINILTTSDIYVCNWGMTVWWVDAGHPTSASKAISYMLRRSFLSLYEALLKCRVSRFRKHMLMG